MYIYPVQLNPSWSIYFLTETAPYFFPATFQWIKKILQRFSKIKWLEKNLDRTFRHIKTASEQINGDSYS